MAEQNPSARYHLPFVVHTDPLPGTAVAAAYYSLKGSGPMREFAKMDRVLDEVLVQLGGMVLRMSAPEITRSNEERRALARSVNQYSVCAASSDDPRVHRLKVKLEETLKPRLRLIVSR